MAFFIQVLTVKDNSMSPAFAKGQKVFVVADYYDNKKPQRREVAVIELGTPNYPCVIRRIAFVSGDVLSQSDNNKFQGMNEQQLILNLALSDNLTSSDPDPDPGESIDGRGFDLVLEEELSGKVVK